MREAVSVRVYLWYQIPKCDKWHVPDEMRAPHRAIDTIAREEADRLIADGLAKSCERGKAIQILERQGTWAIRGESCSVGPALIERFVAGELRAHLAIGAYR